MGTWIPGYMWEDREENDYPNMFPVPLGLRCYNLPFPLEASEVHSKCNLCYRTIIIHINKQTKIASHAFHVAPFLVKTEILQLIFLMTHLLYHL